MSTYKIFIHAIGRTACDYYRAVLPYNFCREPLAARGVELTIGRHLDADAFDCYVFRRDINPSFLPYLYELKFVRGKKIVWDMDDDLFAIPEWSPVRFDRDALSAMSLALLWADRVTCTTIPLADSLESRSGGKWASTVLPNLIDLNEWREPLPRGPGPVRVLWAGSEAHGGDLDTVADAVAELIKEYKDDVVFYFMGMMPESLRYTVENISELRHRVVQLGGVPLPYYPGAVRAAMPDIALLPLESNHFNVCKSNIKYLEMTMAGAACVASSFGPYLRTIRETMHDPSGGDEVGAGILVGPRQYGGNTESWATAVGSLIDDRLKRRGHSHPGVDSADSIVRDAKEFVINNYSWQGVLGHSMWVNFFAGLRD